MNELQVAGISDIFDFFDNVKIWFTDFGRWISDPLWLWYLGLFAFVVIVLVAAVFLPFKWARVGLGGTILLAVAYVLGGRRMHNRMKDEVAEERARYEELKRKQKEGGSSGGWWWGN